MTVSANDMENHENHNFTSEIADLEITGPNIEHQKGEKKPCIICNKIKMKGDVKRYRICEIKEAKQLVSEMRFFRDDIYNRCVLLETADDCLSNFLLKFKRKVELIVNDEHDFTKTEDIDQMFRDILEQIDLQHQAIHVSTVRDLLNEKFYNENIGMLTSSET